jgi:hypothetical protein
LDRDGTLGLLLAQPVRLRTLALAKVSARAALVFSSAAIFSMAGFLFSEIRSNPAVYLPRGTVRRSDQARVGSGGGAGADHIRIRLDVVTGISVISDKLMTDE